MTLETLPYAQQMKTWPKEGRWILAQYDTKRVTVYQAYRQAIGRFAIKHQYFGGEFRLNRMSWIKPSFLWMMSRSGWASKAGQEVVLAVHIYRRAFDAILSAAVHSTFQKEIYGTLEVWRQHLAESEARLQWDPDRDPGGGKVARRAIQLGLRGTLLSQYAREWIAGIEDITDFVREQREHAFAGHYDRIVTPKEIVYRIVDASVAERVGVTRA